MQKLQHQTLLFADFTLDLTRGCLLRGEQEIKLRPKSFEVLRYLVENGGRLVSKDELIEAVWPGTAVTDDSLVQCLIEVRRALGDSQQRIIKTVPRRGYIFDAEVMRRDSTVQELIYTEDVEGVRIAIEEEANEQFPVLTSSDAMALTQTASSGLTTLEPAKAAATHPRSSAEYVATKIKKHRSASLAVLVILLLAIGGLGFWYFSNRPSNTTQIESIVVLPFQNVTGNSDTEYLSDGISEALINSLTELPQLRVIARPTAFRYRGKEVDPQTVGRDLNVRALLTGRVRQMGDRLNVRLCFI